MRWEREKESKERGDEEANVLRWRTHYKFYLHRQNRFLPSLYDGNYIWQFLFVCARVQGCYIAVSVAACAVVYTFFGNEINLLVDVILMAAKQKRHRPATIPNTIQTWKYIKRR